MTFKTTYKAVFHKILSLRNVIKAWPRQIRKRQLTSVKKTQINWTTNYTNKEIKGGKKKFMILIGFFLFTKFNQFTFIKSPVEHGCQNVKYIFYSMNEIFNDTWKTMEY